MQSVFDNLDRTVNEGKGNKHPDPRDLPTADPLAWSEEYLMQAYAEMYRSTGDERYLDNLCYHIDSVIHCRDDFRGTENYKGDLVPAWGTDLNTKVWEWKHFSVHTGIITYPMLEFVQLVRENKIKRRSNESETVQNRVREAIDYHDDEWVLQKSGFGLYTFREDYYGKHNYVCPLSQQATIGRSLLLLWKLTGEERYRQKANDIALAIKRSLKDDEHCGYVWGIEVGPLSGNNHVAIISHSAITVHLITLAYESGLTFSSDDIEKVISTIKLLLADGRAER